MRISCPNCSAEYDVPDLALAAGPRLLRCARCGHSFKAALPEAPAPVPAPESMIEAPAGFLPPGQPPDVPVAPPPVPQAESADGAHTPSPPSGGAAQDRLASAPASPADRIAMTGWVMTLLVLVLAAYAGFAWRADIMAAWPPSERLYTLLGLA